MNRRRDAVAIFPGSFDPITNGHLDIVTRGLSIFREVLIAILVNPDKRPLFTVEERVEIIRKVVRSRRVRVTTFSGLLVDYAEEVGASVIIRGLRAISDFEYEFQMALMNRRLDPRIETVFMIPWGAHFRELSCTVPLVDNVCPASQTSLFGLMEMIVFILILLVGLIYVWKKGALQWD